MLTFKSLNETVPHGVKPSYYHESKHPFLMQWCVVVIVLSIVIVALRFWARRLAKQSLLLDDWLALAAVPFCIAQAALTIWQMSFGFGRHQVVISNTNPHYNIDISKVVFIVLFIYQAGIGFFKLSLLALYWRLFAIKPWVRYYVTFVAGIVVTWTITIELLNLFRCHPISANWLAPLSSHCVLSFQRSYYFVQTIPTIFLDVAILGIPIPIIWTIQLSTSSKLGMTFLFLATCCGTVISAVRLHLSLNAPKVDTSYTRIQVRVWSLAELLVGIFSACLLTYGPLVHLAIKKFSPKSKESFLYAASKSKHTPPEVLVDEVHLVDVESSGRSYKENSGRSYKENSKEGSLHV